MVEPSARKYIAPVEIDKEGHKRILLPALGNIPVGSEDQALMIYSPGMPWATVYTYVELADIVHWIREDQSFVRDAQKVRFDSGQNSELSDSEESVPPGS